MTQAKLNELRSKGADELKGLRDDVHAEIWEMVDHLVDLREEARGYDMALASLVDPKTLTGDKTVH